MEYLVKNKFDELIKLAKSKNYDAERIALLTESFHFAHGKHNGQIRKSGEPYIIHPLQTAIFLMEWNMDIETVIAGLLHDVIEDCNVSFDEIKEKFGDDIATLVMYVTKVSKISKDTRITRNNANVENHLTNDNYTIQVFLSMSKDLRAMIIKLADRLHNMQTIKSLKEEKQKRIANETFAIYANIAGRLGMYDIKTELLDRSFEVLEPQKYQEVVEMINWMIENNESKWNEMNHQLENLLKISNISYQLKRRIKGIYSTYKKLESGVELKDIHDIFATRIIVNTAIECYHVLGLVHLNFIYLKGAFKDYISKPKANLYQSIHTTLTINNSLFEVQIRDEKMDLFAKYGVASHWKYKEKTNNDKIAHASNILLQQFNMSKNKSIDDVKSITSSEIFDILVLNNNEWYTVTDNSTVLDVAFRFNNEELPYLTTAYVNGQRATFEQKLTSGDTIKFYYTTLYKMVKSNWINAVTTHTAKVYIKELLQKEQNHAPKLEEFLQKVTTKFSNSPIDKEEILRRLKDDFNFTNLNQWWQLVTSCDDFENEETQNLLINYFSKNKELNAKTVHWIKKNAANWIIGTSYFNTINDIYFNQIIIPTCCSKLPGMDIIGILKESALTVHKTNCKEVMKNNMKKIVMSWNEKTIANYPRKFRVKIVISGAWTESVGNMIARILDNKRANIAKITINKIKDNMTYDGEIIAYFRDLKHLNDVLITLEYNDIINKYTIY